jgi:hypothetical protein
MNNFSSTDFQVVRRTSSVLLSRTASFHKISRAALLPIALLCTTACFAQSSFVAANQPLTLAPPASSTESSSVALPEAPSTLLATPLAPEPQLAPKDARTAGPVAPKYSMTISAGFQAQTWSQHDKVVAGLRDLYSISSITGEIASAGYSHLTNGQPNYGVNSEAFGKRVGASFARDTSETLFTEVILAPVFHEDPRYYVEGPTHNLVHRTLYAVTRPIITRTDHGHSTINASLLLGYAGASALSYTYYPAINQNTKDTVATFGGALAGAAVGDFVSEFLDDVLQAVHIEKRR